MKRYYVLLYTIFHPIIFFFCYSILMDNFDLLVPPALELDFSDGQNV